MKSDILFGDNLEILGGLDSESFQMIYIDPPYNTKKTQKMHRQKDGAKYGDELSYEDTYEDFLAFLEPRLREAHRLLKESGTIYVHLDYREVHYVKVLMDSIFGRSNFLNEIIWAYDYGGKSKRKWPAKHDNILVYVKDVDKYYYNSTEVDREPYMAPGLAGSEKSERGKLPTDCYSDDTDILTGRGWIPFRELTLEDTVATVSPSAELSFVVPEKIHKYEYSGDMIHFKSKTVDLLVTPNHKMYMKKKHRDQYEFFTASSLFRQLPNKNLYYSTLNKVKYTSGVAQDTFEVPKCDYIREYCAKPLPVFNMKDWCSFMGWYLSEGSTTLYKDRAEVQISQQKEKNIPIIKDLLDSMGLKYRYDGRCFIICNKQLTLYLKQFGYAHEKYIPHSLLELPIEYLERLYEALMLGDGNTSLKGLDSYITTSYRLASDVQELMFKLGYNSSINERKMDSTKPNWKQCYYVQRRVSQESTTWVNKHLSMVDYSGYVYCCTVAPYHTLVVRRNGRPTVSGNCWWHTIVPTNGTERTGYPTQKPEGILRRMIVASTATGDDVLDFFAGSGTTGAVAKKLGRGYVLIDQNPQAIDIMKERI